MAESTAKLNILVQLEDQASAAVQGLTGRIQDVEKSMQPAISASKTLAAGFAIIGGAALAGGTLAINAARETIAAQNQLGAVLKSTGGVAGVTADAVNELAGSLAQVTNFGDDAIVSAQNMLLTFTNIGKDVFPAATETVLNLSAAMGTDLNSSAIQLGKALNNPIDGITALTRVGVTFTDAQKDMITKLVETGKTAEAQKIILKELATEFGGVAKATADPITQLKNNIGELAESVGLKLMPVVAQVAQSVNDFVNGPMQDWIVKGQELIGWLEQHKTVLLVVAGAITGALLPAFIALGVTLLTVTIPAFVAAAIALAPWIAGGALIAGIVAGIMWIVQHWTLVSQKATEIWNSIASFLAGVWEGIKSGAETVFNAIKNFFETIWNAIVAVFNFWVALVSGIVISIFDKMGIDIVGVFEKIADFFAKIWDDFKTLFVEGTAAVSELWHNVWDSVSSFFGEKWEFIKNIAASGWETLTGIYNKFKEPLAKAWSSMWSGTGAIVDSVWQGIKGSVTNGLNWVIDKINSFITATNNVASKGAGAVGVSIPQLPTIPRLAEGGIVTRPTIAMIGEAGAEAIIPLKNGGGFGGSNISISLQGDFYTDEQNAERWANEIAKVLKSQLNLTIRA